MNPEIEVYIENHISPEPEHLRNIDRSSNLRHNNGRMCSGHIQGRLLKMLTSMIKPKKVLELGTFTGYSALCIAEALGENSEVHTIESDDELEEEILENISSSSDGEKIKLHIGDALTVMGQWEPDTFDLAVVDADKRQYPQYLEKLISLVKPEGYIIADNTLWDGHVTEQGKHSSQTQGILKFNDMVVKMEGLEVAILPVRDGVTLIKKLDKES